MALLPPRIESLAGHHNRQAFYCGKDSLDAYIQRQAGQDSRRRVARVFVAIDDHKPTAILGFYTLSATSVEARTLPPELAHQLPNYPLPAALIGRLAVDQRYQGKNLGRYLLVDALARTVSASSSIAIYAVVVDAINEHAETLYEKYGFLKLPGVTRRLFIPLKTITS